jgi:DNA-binding NtrC family response regulator
VEDDDDSREIFAEVLSSEYDVLTAADGPSALDTFRRDRPDVVVTDQSLPGIEGTQLAREVKEVDPNARVVLVSGHGHLSGTEACDAVLEKPVEIDQLTAVIGAFPTGSSEP